MSVTWWEKTVEYNFVVNASTYGLNILAPLDGKVESAGDVIVGVPDKFFIIEFKREKNDIPTEFDKFQKGETGYEKAKKELDSVKKSTSHYLIYGEYEVITKEDNEEGKNKHENKLILNFVDYFDFNNIITHDDKSLYFKKGMSLDELHHYILRFTYYKNIPNKNGNAESSSGSSESLILAIDKDNNVQTIPVEYYKKMKNEFKDEIKKINDAKSKPILRPH
ncbi:MAG: hypothetical protein KA732_12800 [Providencia sp.]|uniref:hypothetical protein n=1 Tax=Providencia sp. TaxID=589 RepID=UPI001B69D5ED|nr:hypothetical protein [Providencia sp.]MBP6082143.1 hypothetical protein [Providencia sp.]